MHASLEQDVKGGERFLKINKKGFPHLRSRGPGKRVQQVQYFSLAKGSSALASAGNVTELFA